MTSSSYPSDMDIISCLGVGYQVKVVYILPILFNGKDAFDHLKLIWDMITKGYKGIRCGGKRDVLDVMNIMKEIWYQYYK